MDELSKGNLGGTREDQFLFVSILSNPSGFCGGAAGPSGILCGVLECREIDLSDCAGTDVLCSPSGLGIFPLARQGEQSAILQLYHTDVSALSGYHAVKLYCAGQDETA